MNSIQFMNIYQFVNDIVIYLTCSEYNNINAIVTNSATLSIVCIEVSTPRPRPLKNTTLSFSLRPHLNLQTV